MKLTAIILITACLHVSATGFSQTVSLSEKNASLEKIFQEVRKQTGYEFFYSTAMLQSAQKVTVEVKDASIKEVLDLCFSNQPLSYTIYEKTIVVKQKEPALNKQNPVALPLTDIAGIVTDENGVPLNGANVIFKITGKGTTTDVQGKFLLKGEIDEKTVVVVSYVGYVKQEIKIEKSTFLNVRMKVAANDLDKVVVQGYGKTSDRLRTGNIVTVTGEEIERQPLMNPIQALQGKVPGMIVSINNGYATAPVRIEIRGRSVINSNLPSEPLYVIDGVPLQDLNLGLGGNYASGSSGINQNGFNGPAGGLSPLFSLNPQDVESISVLKDADATSIYGSRGANGVILITTKKGKPGKSKLEVKVYQGVGEVTKHYAIMNTQQYVQMRKEAFKNDNVTMTALNAYDLLLWDTTHYTDWQKELWGKLAKTVNLHMVFSGGDKQTTFRISGGYERQTEILGGDYGRGTVQLNLTHRSLSQRFMTSFTSFYSYENSELIGVPNAVLLPPNAPSIFDIQGKLNYRGWGAAGSPGAQLFERFGILLRPYTEATGTLNSNLNFRLELLKGLSVSASLGYRTFNGSQMQIKPIASLDPSSNPTGSSQFGNNAGASTIAEPQIEYDRFIGKGKLNVLVGGSYQTQNANGNTIAGYGYTNDNLLQSVANAPTTQGFTNSGEYKYAALFSRINYNWQDKYILNLSARRDGSSRFGPGNQFGNFGSIGVAWIFTQEKWVKKHVPFLSFGKLRGSYGSTGSDNISNYQYLSQWSANGITPYEQGIPSYVPTLLENTELKWQSNQKLEAALSLGLLKDKINFEISAYRNRCGNQLATTPLPSITGFRSVTTNLPALIQNTGLEIIAGAKIVDNKNFGWTFHFNIGFNNNKLVSFPNLSQSPYAGNYVIGKSLGIKRLLHYLGVDPQTGQYSFEDKNHNGVIDTYSQSSVNDAYDLNLDIKYDGGLSMDFRYKGVQLNCFLNFRKQLKPAAIGVNPGKIGNASTLALDHWQKPGDQSLFARYTLTSAVTDNAFYNDLSDGQYSDGSYIRLRNLSVSYNLPEKIIQKLTIKSCQIFMRGQNLFILTKYNGIDPDTPSLGTLPPKKMYTFGLQFNL